jgi:phytoene dehydrogenase-like protein
MTEDFDAIIIGGGHNGLACAAYLGRAGYKVKVLEARHVIGGAAVTEEFHPGFRNSSCSYVVSMLHPQIQRDLELARHGLKIIQLKQDITVPTEDGNYLTIGEDVGEDTDGLFKQLEALAPGDGAAYVEFEHLLTEVADVLRGVALKTPPNLVGGWKSLLDLASQGAAARHLSKSARCFFAELMTSSVGHLLDKWFKGDAIKGELGYHGSVGNFQSPYTPGTAYVLLHHVFGEATGVKGAWGHAIGGMGAISDAIAADAVEHGASIECNARVAEVLTQNGKASGVKLTDGRELTAKVVISNAHPRILFDKLVDPALLPATFKREISGYRSGSGTLRMNVALSELPDFTCLPGTRLQLHHQGSILICPSLAYLQTAYDQAYTDGYSKRPAIEMWISSSMDDSLAPAGKHVASLFCQHFNPNLPNGKNWDIERDAAAARVIATMTEFAPNFKASILGLRILSPLDLEREFNLVSGDIFHGSLHLDQMYSLRPVAGYADYRTPVAGLYICGSGTHPGGGVSGIPGRNAAKEIIKDLKRVS